ncbi:MAG: XdhC family protein [Planctomycetota bacterium]
MTADGVDAEWLARLRSPMGLPIGARDHAEIAVSVVAEMIAVRRGVDSGQVG